MSKKSAAKAALKEEVIVEVFPYMLPEGAYNEALNGNIVSYTLPDGSKYKKHVSELKLAKV